MWAFITDKGLDAVLSQSPIIIIYLIYSFDFNRLQLK